MARLCWECDKPLTGRIDKRFCDDACRSNYNNRQNRDHNQLMRSTHYALRRNYRILMKLNPRGKVKMSRKRMLEEGFSFEYITQMYRTHKGALYCYVYNQGYLDLGNDWFLLVKRT